MRWLRRILDRRKAVKERNHKKVIHDLLTMDRSDMVGFVRDLDKSVKKNEFIDYGGGFLCLLAIPVILVMLFVFQPAVVLLCALFFLLAAPSGFFAFIQVSAKLSFTNKLVLYLAEIVYEEIDETRPFSKSAYMDCLSRNEDWNKLISDTGLERPMRTIMDYLQSKDATDRDEVAADTLKAILPAMILDKETKYGNQRVMDETVSSYHIKESIEHIADNLPASSENEIDKIWNTTMEREKVLKAKKDILTKSADNARLEDLRKRLDQATTDVDEAINDIDKAIKSIDGKAD